MGNPPRPRQTSACLLRADRLTFRVWQLLTGYRISSSWKVSCLPEPVKQPYVATEHAAVHALSAGPVNRPAFDNPLLGERAASFAPHPHSGPPVTGGPEGLRAIYHRGYSVFISATSSFQRRSESSGCRSAPIAPLSFQRRLESSGLTMTCPPGRA